MGEPGRGNAHHSEVIRREQDLAEAGPGPAGGAEGLPGLASIALPSALPAGATGMDMSQQDSGLLDIALDGAGRWG